MKSILLNHVQIENKTIRLAHQILENNFNEKTIVLIGLNKRGNILCENVKNTLTKIFKGSIEHYNIIAKKNENNTTEFLWNNTNIENKTVILIDDVVDTGQTLMNAACTILNFNPSKLQTLALIDRNHRNFPIRVDYVGMHVATTLHENVVVEFDVRELRNNCAFLN
jgi:pyrimidine operon attenuation protein/uracil phosphoribosyltransferase